MTSTGFSWSDFYLICFAVGFCFSFFSFVFGGSHFGRLHLPHFHGHAGAHISAGHGVAGNAHAGHASAGVPAPDGSQATGAHQAHHHSSGVSPFNPPTLAAFLAWFGGTGYLLTRYSALWVGTGLLFAVLVGIAGGGIVFLFMSKVLMSNQEVMDPADYDMVGVLGKLSVSIREGGTGELIYSQAGTRRVCGARSEDGSAIAKGIEVVVTRYDKGIAYVRLWSEMSGEQDEPASEESKER